MQIFLFSYKKNAAPHFKRLLNCINCVIIYCLSLGMLSAQMVAGPDTTICVGNPVTLTANPTNVVFTPPTNANINSDDTHGGIVNIGFSFTFYGNTYNQCVIASNDYITFDLSQANTYSQWPINNAIPTTNAPMNAIMGPWQDINPAQGGTIKYATYGTAPNRVFVVEWLDVPMFSCLNLCFSNQIKLFEGTNIIETHIFTKNVCTTWNNGQAIHGLQNANGTIADVVPGRNAGMQWVTASEGYRFTPVSSTNYNITQIPFLPTALTTTSSIIWTTLSNQQVGTGDTLIVSPTTTTSYIAKLQYGTCGTAVIGDTVTVTVGSIPVNITPAAPAICVGDSVQLTATANSSNPTYSWNASTTLSDTSIANPYASPTTTTTYIVNVTDSNCTGGDTVTVTAYPLPTINITPTQQTVCPGDSVIFSASGASTYNWTNTQNTNTDSTASVNYLPQGPMTIYLTGTDANGCVNYDTATANVFPATNVSINPQMPGFCFGKNIQLIASGANNYIWQPNSYITNNAIANPIVNPAANSTYTVFGTDINGCKDTASVQVEVYPLPTVAFSANILKGCVPQTINFSENVTIDSGQIVQWQWFFEGLNQTASGQNPTKLYNITGNWDVQLIATSDKGCKDSLTLTDYINIYPNPVADFTLSPQPAYISDPTIFFHNTSSPNVTTWLWNFGDGNTGNISNPTYIFKENGTHTILLIVSTKYGCKDSISHSLKILPISEIWIPNTFTPNGDDLNDVFFPVTANSNKTIVKLWIFNRWGEQIFESFSPEKPWNGYMQNTGDACPTGTYVYRISFINEAGKHFEYRGKLNLLR